MMKILLMMILTISCSKKNDIYARQEMLKLAKAKDETATLVLAGSLEEALSSDNCKEYGPGCLVAIKAKILDLEVIFVEFEKASQARVEALRIDQMSARNWVIDDVKGEPPLEAFMSEVYGAKLAIPHLKKE